MNNNISKIGHHTFDYVPEKMNVYAGNNTGYIYEGSVQWKSSKIAFINGKWAIKSQVCEAFTRTWNSIVYHGSFNPDFVGCRYEGDVCHCYYGTFQTEQKDVVPAYNYGFYIVYETQ